MYHYYFNTFISTGFYSAGYLCHFCYIQIYVFQTKINLLVKVCGKRYKTPYFF